MTEDEVVALVARWFEAHEPVLGGRGPGREDAAVTAVAELAASLAGTNVGLWLAEAAATGRVCGAAGDLIGQVAGARFGSRPDLRTLRAAELLVWSPGGWEAFSAATAKIAMRQPQQLADCLERLVYAFTAAPRDALLAVRGNACVFAERYRLAPVIDDAWGGRDERWFIVGHQPAFEALRRCAPSLYLHVLDVFPHPEPVRQLIVEAATHTPLADVLAMLDIAPPSSQGMRGTQR